MAPPSPRARTRALIPALSLVISAVIVVGGASPGQAFQLPHDRTVSAAPASWTPQILDGRVEAIVQVGTRMIAAGTFSQAQNASGGTTYARNRILAFNATTGTIDTAFAPNVGGEITSMIVAPDGNVIIGGLFTSVNGITANRLAKLNPTTGALVTTFKPNVNGRVNDIALWGNQVVLGGAFAKVNTVARTDLAAVDATTGALGASPNLAVTGLFNGGTTNIQKLDVSPDGSKLVVIGNFTSVGGQSRVQIAMIDLSTVPASVSSWATDGFIGSCAGVFNTYMRDVEFSPDGAYFVIGVTGAGYFPTTLCDTVTRWESDETGPGRTPTWVDYSGGDTITAVAVTGSSIYAGGHQRWMNNDAVGDVAAAGAVSRDGLAALDPQNGVPLKWNPTRNRGVGVFAFLATPTGLWIGHDTAIVAHQTHNRIAFFPLAGGTQVVRADNLSLPGTLFTTARTVCPADDSSVLLRINTGGPAIASNDCGPDWQGDQDFDSPYRNSGSNVGGPWSLGAGVTSSVPAGTPRTIFDTERWSPSDSPAMDWSIDEPAGMHLQVRLYFSNGYDGTSQPGQREFNVALDGASVLSSYDIVADVGNKIGTMKPFNITSDGTVNIDFSHVVENPLVNGIEIVDLDAPPLPQPEYCTGTDTSILYRIDAGGPNLSPHDCGPVWADDQGDPSPVRNNGSNTGAWDPVLGVSNAVPSATPRAIFRTERWSPSDTPAMQWAFPVDAGTNVRVRLYFANNYPGTSQTGQRVFNVALEGTTVLSNYDIAADVGDRTGTMKAFDVTSDGVVNIDFSHFIENPLVNGIEIVDLDVPAGPQPISSAEFLGKRSFDGSTLGTDGQLATPGTDWSQAAGAFFVNGRVYAGWADGGLYRWSFDGTNLGTRVDVLQQGNYVFGRTWTSFTDVTGMFWCDGKLYYTRSGDAHLFYRYFSPDSELVGSIQYVASGPGVDDLDWSQVEGMTEASGELVWASTDGDLHRIDFTDGAPVEGTDALIGGPTFDGRDWRTNAMFLMPQLTPDTTDPSIPGTPTGVSHTDHSIDLTWGASTDDRSTVLTYRIYGDGNPTPVGQVVSDSTGTVSFTVSGLAAGSVHTYRVDALDGATNASDLSGTSSSIAVLNGGPPIFTDGFTGGNFAAWTTNSGLTIDASQGGTAPPSARESTVNQTASAYRLLPGGPYTTICASAAVRVTSQGTAGIDLFRLRTAGNGAIAKAFMTTAGKLAIRSDFAANQVVSTMTMPAGWHVVELCGTVGSAGSWDLYLDGTALVTSWVANTGTVGVGRIQIGNTSMKTTTINWDDVVVDQTPG